MGKASQNPERRKELILVPEHSLELRWTMKQEVQNTTFRC